MAGFLIGRVSFVRGTLQIPGLECHERLKAPCSVLRGQGSGDRMPRSLVASGRFSVGVVRSSDETDGQAGRMARRAPMCTKQHTRTGGARSGGRRQLAMFELEPICPLYASGPSLGPLAWSPQTIHVGASRRPSPRSHRACFDLVARKLHHDEEKPFWWFLDVSVSRTLLLVLRSSHSGCNSVNWSPPEDHRRVYSS